MNRNPDDKDDVAETLDSLGELREIFDLECEMRGGRRNRWNEDTVFREEILSSLIASGKRDRRNLVAGLKHKCPVARAFVAEALQQIGWQPTTPLARAFLAVALGNCDAAAEEGENALTPLLLALASELPGAEAALLKTRCPQAVAAVERVRYRRKKDAIERALQLEECERHRSLMALGVADLDVMLEFADNPEVARALGEIGDERAVESLLSAKSRFPWAQVDALEKILIRCIRKVPSVVLQQLRQVPDSTAAWVAPGPDITPEDGESRTVLRGRLRSLADEELVRRSTKQVSSKPNTTIDVVCLCGARYCVDGGLVGRRAKCHHCQSVMIIGDGK